MRGSIGYSLYAALMVCTATPALADPTLLPSPLKENAAIAPLTLPDKTNERRAAPVTAKNTGDFRFKGVVRTLGTLEDNQDLGTRSDTLDTGLAIDARASALYKPRHMDIRGYGEVRGYKGTGVIDTRSDDGNDTSLSDGFVEMRQLWLEFYNLAGDKRLSTKLGRQRFREDRGLWWNADLDAARLSLRSALTDGFIAIGNDWDNYRIGDNDDFREDRKNRLRLFGEVSHRVSPGHTIDARFMAEHDHSDTPRIGDVFSADNIDREDADLLWIGLRGHGTVPAKSARIVYHLEGMGVAGEETVADTAPGPGGGQRTVTGTRSRDVFGWAVDSRLSVALSDAPRLPVFNAGYAYASGDDNPRGTGDNNAFRQTGMQGNTSLMTDNTDMGRVRHYGEVLRPELSNIHILSLGAHAPLYRGSGLTLNYYNYWLAEETGTLRSSGINAPLNGTDSYLGQAADMILYVPIADDMRRGTAGWMDSITSRFVLGGFRAGNAYGAAEGDVAWRGTAELRVRF